MHEMSLALSILEMAEKEALTRNCNRLLLIRVAYGPLSGVMPEALKLCVQSLIGGTIHQGMRFEMVKLPLRLRCPFCNAAFGGDSGDAIWLPCPQCGESFAHIVEQGKELLLSHLEADHVEEKDR